MKKIPNISAIILLMMFPSLIFSQISHTINSGNFYYSPSVLSINVGDTVSWINDGGFHNVNFDVNTITGLSFNNPEDFISSPTSSAEMYTHIFTIAGNYEYDCSVGSHAVNGMTGTIIVNANTTYLSGNKNISLKYLIGTYSLLGNMPEGMFSQFIINRYSDGSVEKRVVIK